MDSYSVISYKTSELPKQYEAMVFSRWLRSLRNGAPWFEHIDSEAFYKNYHSYIENLMQKPDSLIKLAILTEDPDVVLGFSVSRENVLDYVHVQHEQRKQGIGSKLLPPMMTTMSHLTQLGMEIWQKRVKYKHLKFNPFA